jgi:hypothetical protein
MMISERLRKLSSNTPEKLEASVSPNTDDVDVTDAVVVEQEEDEHE